MELIKYRDFSALNLNSFVEDKNEIQIEEDFEFMGDLWLAHSIGFTDWLYHIADPNTRALCIDLQDLSDEESVKMISGLGLPVTTGMSHDEIIEKLGDPASVEKFVEGRISLQYLLGTGEKYYLSLTVDSQEGLVYIVMTNHRASIEELENTVTGNS